MRRTSLDNTGSSGSMGRAMSRMSPMFSLIASVPVVPVSNTNLNSTLVGKTCHAFDATIRGLDAAPPPDLP